MQQEEPEAYYLKSADPKHFFYILQFSLSEGKNVAYAYHDLVLITPHQDYNKVWIVFFLNILGHFYLISGSQHRERALAGLDRIK